jgi:hypothetical protein
MIKVTISRFCGPIQLVQLQDLRFANDDLDLKSRPSDTASDTADLQSQPTLIGIKHAFWLIGFSPTVGNSHGTSITLRVPCSQYSFEGPGSITAQDHRDNALLYRKPDSCEERSALFSIPDQSLATNLSELTISSCSAVEKIGVATDHSCPYVLMIRWTSSLPSQEANSLARAL